MEKLLTCTCATMVLDSILVTAAVSDGHGSRQRTLTSDSIHTLTYWLCLEIHLKLRMALLITADTTASGQNQTQCASASPLQGSRSQGSRELISLAP